jgi:hypothetical protein
MGGHVHPPGVMNTGAAAADPARNGQCRVPAARISDTTNWRASMASLTVWKFSTPYGADAATGGALGGAFWGMLFGLIFFIPILGLAIGAATGALFGSLADVGISDSFIKSVRDQVTPGTSALFLLSSDAVIDRVREEFPVHEAELISTNLSADQEAKLREAFAE